MNNITDLEKFKELYTSVGVNFKIFGHHTTGAEQMRLTANETNKVSGFCGFETSIQFDEDGKFIEQGIYE